jgi:hypothetical protein
MESKIGAKNRFLPIVIALALFFGSIYFLISLDYSFLIESYKKELPKLYEECITKNLTIVYYGDFGYNCSSIKEDYSKFYAKNDRHDIEKKFRSDDNR